MVGLQERENLNMTVSTDGGHSNNLSEQTDNDLLPGGQLLSVQGGGEQEPAATKKRRYVRKLKGGQSRNGIKQTDIKTFAVSRILGDGSTKTETGTNN